MVKYKWYLCMYLCAKLEYYAVHLPYVCNYVNICVCLLCMNECYCKMNCMKKKVCVTNNHMQAGRWFYCRG
jgi:hypothetical protein